MAAFEAVIGLEVHAQLLSQAKIFCPVKNAYGEEANTVVGAVSGGLPGALPVLNARAVELAVRAGLALHCEINHQSVFSRKNYFYPDSPKGFQLSQFDEPVCGPGYLDIAVGELKKRIGIERIHMEDDAGKSMHMASTTLINLNRSGVPLIEIVSRPDMRGPQEASAYLKILHAILVYADICDGNLEEGNFRCDANVSVRRMGETKLGTRCELKNINSFKFIESAIEYEISRQIAVVEAGDTVTQETRGWDSAAGKTFLMRKKEDAHDYRYFPEPDLPPLRLDATYIDKIRREMPELPEAKRQRFVTQLGLTEYDAREVTVSRSLAEFFEATVAAGAPAKTAVNWILTELFRALKEKQTNVDVRPLASPVAPAALAKLIALIERGTISGKIAKVVFEEMFEHGGEPDKIVEQKGLVQVLDTGAIETWVDEILQTHPAQVADYKAGKMKVYGFFVGEIMKLSRGKANPQALNEILKRKLS